MTTVIRVAVLAGGGAVACYDFADRSTVTAARVKPPTAKTAVSGATVKPPTAKAAVSGAT
ncbi:hypothetical protein FC50_GL001423 [Lacticaseibacillus pantheris DSM 15945 = JCM 12539 = NBRC 106106]|uniref:Uncharacterized protein n=1 Tax=Lacticaseibacillus pantheris DSM 15945 = JCM 12539 = NBRC 106106 TaxID=1423783 RepID=A0A0R1TXL6_9LACO|nr:hypothetical protein FC50_GL001423 [Lacticaseibacillus pantheris DSM 15945 = JCM 12539 = NBRC 106106]